jgi:hypothetical protein
MSDPGSLQNLNEIVLPAPVPWWPPAPGWYLLAGFLLLLLMFLAVRWRRRWLRNAYRRRALAELAAMREDESELRELPALLKRTALAAWPRQDVAGLSGTDWHEFLDASGGEGRFRDGAGLILDRLSYGAAEAPLPDVARRLQLLEAAECWLRRHRDDDREART